MYLLDTDLIAILQRQTQPEFGRLAHRMGMHPPTALYYSVVSLHEQVMGANQYITRARNTTGVAQGYALLGMVLATFCRMQVLPFDAAAAVEFDALRARKIRIGTMDLRIASIAVSRKRTVLTRNLRDFTQVPGLNVEDWTT